MNNRRLTLVILFLWWCTIFFGQLPIFNSINFNSEQVELYEKFEVAVDLSASFDNPYDYDQISLRAYIKKPNGLIDSIDGFFMEQMDINMISGNTQSNGPGIFKVRYAPYIEGTHAVFLEVQDSLGAVESEEFTFICTSPENQVKKGFVRTGQSNYLEFDNGEQYIPIGENMAWQQNNVYKNYNQWLGALSQKGGNFIRLWHAHWGLGIEWIPVWNNYLGLKKYNQVNSTYQDWLYDFCAEKGIYVMLTLQHHGQFSTNVNPNWIHNPYNAKNGGPISNPSGFFTNEDAKSITKNRLRYIIARWSYSNSIMSWELFNEVDLTDNFEINKSQVIDWHMEMASFIKDRDVYDHLTTTSFAYDLDEDRLWQDDHMDFTQIHYYNSSNDLQSAIVKESNKLLLKYEKPVLIGEFGLGGNSAIAEDDLDGVHIHNAIWSGFLGGSMGTAMTWWWQSYIHPSDLYYHFEGPSRLQNEIKFKEDQMRQHESHILDASSDLIFQPTASWGQSSDTLIQVSNGVTIPSSPTLSSFLYGSAYNTQFRAPPTFEINNTASGLFSVTTGSDISFMSRIFISLDTTVLIDSLAIPNTTYEITVPEGLHIVKVDNTGKDWMSIKEYFISDQGTKVFAVALIGDEEQSGAGWVLNKEYNHSKIGEGILPDPIENASLLIHNVNNSDYTVFWYETLSGEMIASEHVEAMDNSLLLNIPSIYWDLAFTLTSGDQVGVEEVEVLEVNVFPNPVFKGQEIFVSVQETEGPYRLFLYNSEGKRMANTELKYMDGRIRIPNYVSAGIYWLKLTSGARNAIVPFVVLE